MKILISKSKKIAFFLIYSFISKTRRKENVSTAQFIPFNNKMHSNAEKRSIKLVTPRTIYLKNRCFYELKNENDLNKTENVLRLYLHKTIIIYYSLLKSD